MTTSRDTRNELAQIGSSLHWCAVSVRSTLVLDVSKHFALWTKLNEQISKPHQVFQHQEHDRTWTPDFFSLRKCPCLHRCHTMVIKCGWLRVRNAWCGDGICIMAHAKSHSVFCGWWLWLMGLTPDLNRNVAQRLSFRNKYGQQTHLFDAGARDTERIPWQCIRFLFGLRSSCPLVVAHGPCNIAVADATRVTLSKLCEHSDLASTHKI